jgi:hypothetical protein
LHRDEGHAPLPRRTLRFAVLVAVLVVLLPAAAPARGLRAFHGVAPKGQYLNLSLSREGAAVTAGRLRERCRPGGRHQLVKPNALAIVPLAVGDGGRFGGTVRKAGHWTRYRGFVNGTTVVVKVTDAADSLCDGASQRFIARLIK